MNIQDIINLVQPPFTVVKGQKGVIYNESSIALECDKHHIDMFYHRDVLKGGLKCPTCTKGNELCRTARIYAEKLTMRPFILTDRFGPRSTTLVYRNFILKLRLICGTAEVPALDGYYDIRCVKFNTLRSDIFKGVLNSPIPDQIKQKMLEKIYKRLPNPEEVILNNLNLFIENSINVNTDNKTRSDL